MRHRMRSKSDRSDEVEIFKNTSVFTVRLHLRKVDNARRKVAKTFFFWICHCYASETVSGPHLGLDLGVFWAAKIEPKSIRRPSGKASNFEPRF